MANGMMAMSGSPSVLSYPCSSVPFKDCHFDVYNPANGAVIKIIEGADAETTQVAISKAEEAFKSWRTTTLAKRGTLLLKYADAIEKCKGDLGEILCEENGKPLLDADYDINFGLSVFRFFRPLVDKLPSEFQDRGTMYVSL